MGDSGTAGPGISGWWGHRAARRFGGGGAAVGWGGEAPVSFWVGRGAGAERRARVGGRINLGPSVPDCENPDPLRERGAEFYSL